MSGISGIVLKSPIRRNARLSSRASHGHTEDLSRMCVAEVGKATQPLQSLQPLQLSHAQQLSQMESAPISLKKGSLSEADQEILALIQQVPKKMFSPCLENFHLYPIAQKVYQAVTSKMLPSELGVYIQDKTAKRKVYQLVFDTLYRE